jgi:hypothetical protein
VPLPGVVGHGDRVNALALAAMLAAVAPLRAAQDSPRPPAAPAPVAAPRAARESLRTAGARWQTAADSVRVDSLRRALRSAERAHVDSMLAARRRLADSLTRANPPRRDPMRGDAPFFGYRWVFYADVLGGAALSWFVASRFGRRYGGLRTVAAVLWAIIGAMTGAFVFFVVFIANGFWSIGFSAMSPGFFFLVTLLGMVAVLAWVADISTRYRRRR